MKYFHSVGSKKTVFFIDFVLFGIVLADQWLQCRPSGRSGDIRTLNTTKTVHSKCKQIEKSYKTSNCDQYIRESNDFYCSILSGFTTLYGKLSSCETSLLRMIDDWRSNYAQGGGNLLGQYRWTCQRPSMLYNTPYYWPKSKYTDQTRITVHF